MWGSELFLSLPQDEASKGPYTPNEYVFAGLIDAGGEAQVFRIHSIRYDMDFAAKVIMNAEMNASNSAELAAMRAIDHPNVIRLYDHFEINGNLVLVYEFCDGGSLRAEMVLTPEGFSQARFIEVARQLVAALDACHEAQISHGDIKPDNILWRDAERQHCRLGDFGLARFGLSWTWRRYGTLAYMAPELLRPGVFVDPRAADVWALGVTFAEMLLGKRLWDIERREERDRVLRRQIADDMEIEHMLRLMLAPLGKRAPIRHIASLPLFKRCAVARSSSSPVSAIMPPQGSVRRRRLPSPMPWAMRRASV